MRTDAEYRSRESTSGDSSQDLPARLPRAATSRSSHSQASLIQEVSTVSGLLRDTDLHSEERRIPPRKGPFGIRVILERKSKASGRLAAREEDVMEQDEVEKSDEDGEVVIDVNPTASCLKSLEAALAQMRLVNEQVSRGRERERVLQANLSDALTREIASHEQLRISIKYFYSAYFQR